jgi:hypothetical protein
LYFDQKNIIKQRQYAAQKKGVKLNDYTITKKGFYMDYDLKVAKEIPSSGNNYFYFKFIIKKTSHGIQLKMI